MRRQDANKTALAAIGRKKRKIDEAGGSGTGFSNTRTVRMVSQLEIFIDGAAKIDFFDVNRHNFNSEPANFPLFDTFELFFLSVLILCSKLNSFCNHDCFYGYDKKKEFRQ
jgi:uncharacterized protein YfbU (UPF0304 family)